MTSDQCRVLTALAACRTAALGGHVEACDHCQYQGIACWRLLPVEVNDAQKRGDRHASRGPTTGRRMIGLNPAVKRVIIDGESYLLAAQQAGHRAPGPCTIRLFPTTHRFSPI